MSEEQLLTRIPKEDFLSSGSTLLNLATTGTPYGCLAVGKYFWMVGDSSSGKTFLALTILAEASINKRFDDYEIIFDNVEDGALMDIERYYGPKLAARLRAPSYDADGEPIFSDTVENFYYALDDRIQASKTRKGKKFIYVLDSMDALSSKYEGEKFDEKKKASRKGTKAAGDYGDGKAKINSSWIRRVVADLRDTECILIVLSQTRDNIGGGMFDPPTVHAGGHALKFYATFQLWTTLGAKLKKDVNDKSRQIGITSKIAIKKNRITGKEWQVSIPIYWGTGIDDIGSCIDWLIEEKHWESDKSGKIHATDLDFVGKRAALIDKIESESLEIDLQSVVTEVWRKIEDECKVERKNKYAT